MATRSQTWVTVLIVVGALAVAALFMLNRPADRDPYDVIEVRNVAFRDGVVVVDVRCDLGRLALGAREKTESRNARAERHMLRVGLAPVEVQPELNAGLEPDIVVLETGVLQGWGFRPDEIVTEYSVRLPLDAPLEGVRELSIPITVPIQSSQYVGGEYHVVVEAIYRARDMGPDGPARFRYVGTVGREIAPVTIPERRIDEGVGWEREGLTVKKTTGASITIEGRATLEIPPDSLEEDTRFTVDVLVNRHALTLLYGSTGEGRHECARRAYSGGRPLSAPATLRVSYGSLGDWDDLALLDAFEWVDETSIRERAQVDRATKTLTVPLKRSGGMVQLIRTSP